MVVWLVTVIYDWSWPDWSHDWSCDWSYDITTGSATSCDRSRPGAQLYDWSRDWSSLAYKKVLNQVSVSVFFQLHDRAVLKKCPPRKAREGRRGHIQMQKKWLPKGMWMYMHISTQFLLKRTCQQRPCNPQQRCLLLSLLWFLHQTSAAAAAAPSCCCCCKCRWSSMSSSLWGGTNAMMTCSLLSPEPNPFYYTCDWSCSQSWQFATGRATSHGNLQLVILSVIAICDWSCDYLWLLLWLIYGIAPPIVRPIEKVIVVRYRNGRS